MYADQEYIVSLRREIHQYPEIGFELPKTISVVKRELKKMGIEYTENYGRSSVVATLCPDKKQFTIGIRADMDALLIEEKTDLPFRSKIPGQMHACGHDAHTAMLLGTAKALKQMEEKLSCRVMLIFQPSEEGIQSGAAELVRGGLMDEIDIIIGLHIENWLESGTVGVCAGSSMASSRSFRLDFNGKTAHATMPQTGADALAAAVRTYNNIQYMLAREINPFSKHVCSIGKLCGGTGQNIVADHAFMLGTIRTYDMDLDEFLINRIEQIAKNTASETGVEAVLETSLKAYVVYNNPYLSKLVLESAEKVAKNIQKMPEKLSSEDFSQYLTKKPGVFIRLGTRNEEKGCTTLPHNNDFMLDEDALSVGSDACVQFVLDNMNGVDMDKVAASDERRKE
ncbi:MAG: amidohydrolase [Clostridia bacterium]|nr:amidohydrolase [Clostridia bacterium]